MGNLVAEKTWNHRDDVLRDDSRIFFTWEFISFLECDGADAWLYSFHTLDGVDAKYIS